MAKINRILLLMDIIACANTMANLAKILKIKIYLINGWLYNNAKIDLEYSMKMLSFYEENGYVLCLMYKKIPTGREIESNVLYLYTRGNFLEYVLKDQMERTVRVTIAPCEVGACYSEIMLVLEDNLQKNQLNNAQLSLISKSTSKRNFCLKKGYEFTPLDLSVHIGCLTQKDFIIAAKCHDRRLLISERIVGLKQEILSHGSRRGRKKKITEDLKDCFKGKTIELFYKKWGFKSPDEYFRAARVLNYGDPKLIQAMDFNELTVSKAAATVKLCMKEAALSNCDK